MPNLDIATRHQVHLEQLKSGEVNQIAAFLREVAKSLKQQLQGDNLTEFSRTRREHLLAKVSKELKLIFNDYYEELAGHLLDIGAIEAGYEVGAIQAAIAKAGFDMVTPSSSQIRAAIFSNPLSVKGADGGKLLDDFILGWHKSEIESFVGAIRQGAFQGLTNYEIIRNLIGTKKNKYRDGLVEVSRRHAEAMTRTAIQHVSSEARFATWAANKGIVSGYRIIATLDSRTTPICRTLDQQTFKLNENIRPPFHVRCRTTTVAELAPEFDWLKEGRTRSSKDGYVSGSKSYYQWLKTQDKDFIDDVLGVERSALFRRGGLSADAFSKLNLDRNFKQITLEEFKQKAPSAWKNAFN